MENKDLELQIKINTDIAQSNLHELKIWLDLIKEQVEKSDIGSEAFVALGKAIGNTNDRIKLHERALEDIANTSKTVKNVVLLSDTMTDLKRSVEDLDVVLKNQDIGTEEFKEAALKVSEYNKKIEQADNLVKTLASSTPKLDALTTVGENIAGGFAGAKAAAELFGIEVKGITVVLDKVTKANEILNTVQKLNTALQKEGMLATQMATVYQKANTLATSAATLVQKLFGKSVKTTQGSLKGLKAAIVGTGIGALIVGVGLLVEKIIDWTSSSKDQKDAQEDLNQKLAEEKRLLQETTQATIEKWHAQKDGLNQQKRELKLLEASGKSEEELYEKKKIIADKELFDLYYKRQVMRNDPKEVEKINQEILDKRNEFAVETINHNKTIEKREDDAQRKAKEKADKRREENDQATKEKNDKFIKNQEEELRILELKNKLTEDEEIKSLEKIKARKLLTENEYEIKLLEIKQKYKDLAQQKADEAAQKEAEESEKAKEKYKEIQDKRIEINQTFISSQQNSLEISLKNAQTNYDKQIKIQQDLFVKGLINQKTYKKNIIDIEQNSADEVTKIQTDFNTNSNTNLEKYVQSQKDILLTQKKSGSLSESDYNLSIKALEEEKANTSTTITLQANQTITDATASVEETTKNLIKEGSEEKKALLKARYDYWVKTASNASSALDSIGKLISTNDKKQTDLQKGVAVAKLSIDTGIALSNALRNSSAPTADNVITGGLAGIAKYAALAVQIYSNFKTIKGILHGSDTQPQTSTASPSVSVPQISAPQLGGTSIVARQQNSEPLKVFVTEADIRKARNKVNVIEGQSVVV